MSVDVIVERSAELSSKKSYTNTLNEGTRILEKPNFKNYAEIGDA